jgi:MscS family membrane protein
MAVHPVTQIRRALLLLCLAGWACFASATPFNPLKPVDTSSPRATLYGFIDLMESAHGIGVGVLDQFRASSRLFFTPDEVDTVLGIRKYLLTANRTLDLSALPQAMALESSRKLTIQLKEVLDRLELPPPDQVPDAQAMTQSKIGKWTLPNTEISLVRMETGPRAGEVLFSAETVARIPEFYDDVKDRPYVNTSTQGWYERQTKTPIMVVMALHNLIPPRWILQKDYAHSKLVLNQPLWRWLGLVIILMLDYVFIRLASRFERRFRHDRPARRYWARLSRPAILALVTFLTIIILGDVLRFEGFVYNIFIPLLWILHYAALTWLVWVIGEAIAQSIISSEKLKQSSIHSQLIRLILRLANMAGAIFIIVNGADRIGLPSYSVVASLGVGGLAVALAAQQTMANLIGSIIIMLEKPFMIGDTVKIGDAEGVVKSVGFRSTRIKSPNGTVVTIPSGLIVNGAVTNRGNADQMAVGNTLALDINTPPDVLETFVNELMSKLKATSGVDPQRVKVGLSSISGSRLELAVDFYLKESGPDDPIQKRQWLLIDILKLAQARGLKLV